MTLLSIAQKNFELKIEACLVHVDLYVAFRHCFSYEKGLAANFGCNQFRIMPDPEIFERPSEMAVLFTWNLSRHPFLRQVVDIDLLLGTGLNFEHVDLFLCSYFTQRPTKDLTIERHNECVPVGNKCSQNAQKFHFSRKKISCHRPTALNLQSLEFFLV